MNRETKQQIFQHYPEVFEAFKAEEGKTISEREFWKKFFRTYIVEDQRPLEDGMDVFNILYTRYKLVCKIQKEGLFDSPYTLFFISLSRRNSQNSSFSTIYFCR